MIEMSSSAPPAKKIKLDGQNFTQPPAQPIQMNYEELIFNEIVRTTKIC